MNNNKQNNYLFPSFNLKALIFSSTNFSCNNKESLSFINSMYSSFDLKELSSTKTVLSLEENIETLDVFTSVIISHFDCLISVILLYDNCSLFVLQLAKQNVINSCGNSNKCVIFSCEKLLSGWIDEQDPSTSQC